MQFFFRQSTSSTKYSIHTNATDFQKWVHFDKETKCV